MNAFIILVGDRAVHNECTYNTGVHKLTPSLSRAKSWARRDSAQRFADTVHWWRIDGTVIERVLRPDGARVVEIGILEKEGIR